MLGVRPVRRVEANIHSLRSQSCSGPARAETMSVGLPILRRSALATKLSHGIASICCRHVRYVVCPVRVLHTKGKHDARKRWRESTRVSRAR
jgi:hypothetical protein